MDWVGRTLAGLAIAGLLLVGWFADRATDSARSARNQAETANAVQAGDIQDLNAQVRAVCQAAGLKLTSDLCQPVAAPTTIPAAANVVPVPGPQGEKGDKGDPGDAGPRGFRGPRGSEGVPGPSGSVGATGATGETGQAGASCTPDIPQCVGPQGSQGIQGEQGIQGDTGATGPAGVGIADVRLVEIDGDCRLIVDLTDGTNRNLDVDDRLCPRPPPDTTVPVP